MNEARCAWQPFCPCRRSSMRQKMQASSCILGVRGGRKTVGSLQDILDGAGCHRLTARFCLFLALWPWTLASSPIQWKYYLPFRVTARNKEATYARNMSSGVSCIAGTQNLATFIRLNSGLERSSDTPTYMWQSWNYNSVDTKAVTGFSPHHTTPLKTQPQQKHTTPITNRVWERSITKIP